MPDIGRHSIQGQDDPSLLLEPRFDPFLIRQAQGDQFLIAVHQMGHTAQRNADPACHQGLMHFWHTAMLPKTKLPNQGNHVQAKFTMG